MTVSGRAWESQRTIHFKEVSVRADLDRAIAGVLDADAYRRALRVQLDRVFAEEVFAWNHRASPDRIVHGHQFGAVGKRAFDLDFRNHLGDAFHHVVAPEDAGAECHQVGDAPSIADAFEHFSRDEGYGFGMIQLEAARAAAAGHFCSGEHEELVDLPFRETHDSGIIIR